MAEGRTLRKLRLRATTVAAAEVWLLVALNAAYYLPFVRKVQALPWVFRCHSGLLHQQQIDIIEAYERLLSQMVCTIANNCQLGLGTPCLWISA